VVAVSDLGWALEAVAAVRVAWGVAPVGAVVRVVWGVVLGRKIAMVWAQEQQHGMSHSLPLARLGQP